MDLERKNPRLVRCNLEKFMHNIKPPRGTMWVWWSFLSIKNANFLTSSLSPGRVPHTFSLLRNKRKLEAGENREREPENKTNVGPIFSSDKYPSNCYPPSIYFIFASETIYPPPLLSFFSQPSSLSQPTFVKSSFLFLSAHSTGTTIVHPPLFIPSILRA